MGAMTAQAAEEVATCKRCGERSWCAGAQMVCGFCGYQWQVASPEVRFVRQAASDRTQTGDAR